jgi:hypothetical protein
MRIRAYARLVVVAGVAAGALFLAHPADADPGTGGPVSVEDATGTLPHPGDLGPMHIDPVPEDVDLADPVDTATLLEKAGVVGARLAAADQAVTLGATAPLGTPGVSSLSSHVAPSCTSTDPDRVQVLYVHEATTASRYDQVLPLIRNEVAGVDDVLAVSAEQTGGGRRVRWVHTADCLPVVLDVTVPAGALGPDFLDTIDALEAQGYDRPDRKYMVFADANEFCGIGTVYDDDRLVGNLNDGRAASYSRIDANCWSSGHSVPAHELTHNLGGVLEGAPHATANGHCWDESDLMCYADGSGVPMQRVCASAQEQLLDCNHDDYFSTDPAPGSFLATSWNTASSSFLDVVPGPVAAPTVPAPTVPAPPAPAPSAPAPSVRASTSWTVPKVSGGAVSASLLSGGVPQPGASVHLQARWTGSTRWAEVRQLATDGRGAATVPASYAAAGTVRFVLDEDSARSGSVSAAVPVRVSTRVSAGAGRDRVGATLRTAGGRGIGNAVLVLQRRDGGSGRWATVSRSRTDARGAVLRRLSLVRPATFRWVFGGEVQHAPATSPAVRVRP